MTKSNKVWIYGKHAVRAAVLNGNRQVFKVVVLPQNRDFLSDLSVKAEVVDKNYFLSLFGKDVIHQGCAAQVLPLDDVFLEDLPDDDRPIVFLDQVTDPQNIGSILRASAVFGAKAVVLTEMNAPEVTAVIAKVASGALETVPLIKVKNLVQSIKMLKKSGYWCLGLDERGDKKIGEMDLSGKFVLIIGSEGQGMRRLTRENCDFLVQLPSVGSFSTLNAAQAATVSLYEILRQKGSKN
jgi:23S rRNA (guanosine2251-2'-O)-methyltransferase